MSPLLTGDCLEVMAGMEPDSVDAIVCDPPYGLGFMGALWDDAGRLASVPPSAVRLAETGRDPYPRTGKGPAATRFDGRAFQAWNGRWATAALRVLKPGHYLLAFGGTRTVHRLTVALEDSGWIIRDMLIWAYASGFPKGKAQMKPAYEPIVLAKKPGPMVPLGIDAARIGTTDDLNGGAYAKDPTARHDGTTNWRYKRGEAGEYEQPAGRWPANLVLTDPIFDGDTPGVVGGGTASNGGQPTDERGTGGIWHDGNGVPAGPQYGDTGTYSRFFLVPKSSRVDREPNAYGRMVGGLEEGHRADVNKLAGNTRYVGTCVVCGARMAQNATREHCGELVVHVPEEARRRLNQHPTSKPTALMRHLVRLVTPPGGTVLDMFAGSGSTLIAAELEGFAWVGIEQEPEYVAIAEARLAGVQRGLGLDVAAPAPKAGGSHPGTYRTDSVPSSLNHSGRKAGTSVGGGSGTPSRFFLLPRDPADVA